MKNPLLTINNYFRLVICLCLLAGGMGCGSDNSVDPAQIRVGELTAAWGLQSVINDGEDVSSLYSGFVLTISAKTFSTTNGGNAWPSSGLYDFQNGDLDVLVRNDGVVVTITEITSETLVLSFRQPQVSGRKAGITGDFTFNLSKQ